LRFFLRRNWRQQKRRGLKNKVPLFPKTKTPQKNKKFFAAFFVSV